MLDRRSKILWNRGGTRLALLIATLAGASASLAQPQPIQPPQAVPPGGESSEQRSKREQLDKRNADIAAKRAAMRQQVLDGGQPEDQPAGQGFQQPGMAPPNPALAAPGAVQVDNQPLPEGALDHLQGDGMIRLNFGAESITLDALIDYVSQALQINITSDPAVAQQQVLFRAPIEIPKDKLLPLLAAIVEDKGFALVEDPLLGLFVRSAGNVPVQFDGEVFTSTRVIRTPMIRPSSVQSSLTPLIGQASSQLRFAPLDDLGVLIVSGPPRAVQMVEQYVDRLLDEVSGQGLHRYQLNNVEAGYARSRVLTLNGKLGGGAAIAAPGGAATGAALGNLDARMIIDQGNSLVFRGTDEEAQQVQTLVEMVDLITPLIARRYGAGSVAIDVATAGERMGLGPMNESTGGGGGGVQPLARPAVAGAIPGGSSNPEAEVNTSGFTVDAESGAIIYTGTESQHKRVAELVKTFTEQIVGSRIDIKMYKLHNAEAESVASLLTDLIEDDSQGTTGTSPFLPQSRSQGLRGQRPAQPAPAVDGGEAATGEDGAGNVLASAPVEISIVADPDRNQILVKAPAKQQAEIEQIIKRLDERRPQVYIEAQIVGITLNDDLNWAIETQVNAGQFLIFSSFGLSAPGTAVAGQQAAQATRIVPSNRTGLTTAVIKSDYLPFVLNTLQSKTDGKIISNPRILVNDNETGELRSEREEPFATTTQGTATTSTGQGGVATAGTSLTVTPRISKGGYISLDYQVELSSFVGNPVAGLQPPTQREQYNSIVTIPSDSTIVVGGFTLSQKTETDSGIPLLKDIPLIGALFKTFSITNRRTTIFVFITPRIMTDPNFIDLRLASEGPMESAKIEGITPPLDPVTIPIDPESLSESRLVPSNEAPSGP